MTLLVVKIVTLNQSEVIWNKITEVAAILVVVKRKSCRLEAWKEDHTILGTLGPI